VFYFLVDFFLFFFFYISCITCKGTRIRMHREIWRKENLNHKQPPASPFHDKNQTRRVHRKNPPRLVPKKIIPQTCKQTIHRDIEERDPNPSAGSPKTNERTGSRRTERTRGGGCVIAVMRENQWTSGPTSVTINVRSRP